MIQKLFQLLLPPPKMTISQWAKEFRYLSSESAAEPGKWDEKRAPYQQGMMDALSEKGISKVVFMTSAQVGKTSILENITGYYIDYDPSPMMLIQPTLQMAQAFSKDRLSPMFRDTPCLHDKVSTSRTKDGSNTQLHKQFQGGQLTLSGANSPASLASRPIRILLCDEVSRWPKSAGTEGSPLHLAQKRTATFHNKKIVMCSTPGTKGDCVISDEYENSDQREFHVPCPKCFHMQPLMWGQIRYEKNLDDSFIESSVRYECTRCKSLLPEAYKAKMLALGKWKAKKETKDIAGFHLNELYSPWRKWPEVVRDFLQSSPQPERYKVWVNTSLGLPYEPLGTEQPNWKSIYQRRESYTIGLIPSEVKALTAGVRASAS